MNTFSKNVGALLRDRHMTQQKLADSIGVSLTSVNGWIKRGIQPTRRNLELMCDVLACTPDDILSEESGFYAKRASASQQAAISAYASGGYAPLLASARLDETPDADMIDMPMPAPSEVIERRPNAYFVTVVDTSMDKVLPLGCLALVDPDDDPQNGSIAALSINGKPIVRRIYRGASSTLLVADSHDRWDDIVVGDDHLVPVLGKVVWFQPREELQ